MRNRRLATLTLTTFLVSMAYLPAQPGDRFERGRLPGKRLARVLELTPDQVDQLRVLRDEQRNESRRLRDEKRVLRQGLRDMLNEEAPDPKAVGETVLRLHDLNRALRESRQASRDEFRQLLTPEQQERLEALKERRSDRGRLRGRRLLRKR